jgi:hypothetical protein
MGAVQWLDKAVLVNDHVPPDSLQTLRVSLDLFLASSYSKSVGAALFSGRSEGNRRSEARRGGTLSPQRQKLRPAWVTEE